MAGLPSVTPTDQFQLCTQAPWCPPGSHWCHKTSFPPPASHTFWPWADTSGHQPRPRLSGQAPAGLPARLGQVFPEAPWPSPGAPLARHRFLRNHSFIRSLTHSLIQVFIGGWLCARRCPPKHVCASVCTDVYVFFSLGSTPRSGMTRPY